MARAQFYDCGIDSSGNFVTTTQCTVYERGTTNIVSIYDTESTGVLKSNPFISSTGFVTFWVDPGEYDIKVEDVNAIPAFTTRVIGWSSIPAVDGVTAETIADEAINWSKVGYNQDGFAKGYVGRTQPLILANATTFSNYVIDNKKISFTYSDAGFLQESYEDTVFDSSTASFNPLLDGIYLLTCEFDFQITNGGMTPNIKIRHGILNDVVTHDMFNAISVGNVHYRVSTTKIIALAADVTCYLTSHISGGTILLSEGYFGLHMLSPAAQL